MDSMLSLEEQQEKPVAIEGAPPDLGKAIQGCRFAPRCPEARDDCKAEKQHIRTVADREVRCAYAR